MASSSYSYHKIIYTLYYYLVIFAISLLILEIPYVEAAGRLSAIPRGPHYEVAAVGVVARPGTRMYGGRAGITVWKPAVTGNDSSSAYLQISLNRFAYMRAGWIVNRRRYGDFNPRLYIYWTADGGRETGCFDLDCEGFQLFDDNPLGHLLEPISVVGDLIWTMTVQIYQIPSTGDWQFNIRDHPIGYWPASLFTSPVGGGAWRIIVGGSVFDSIGNSFHTKTDMGNGLLPPNPQSSYICRIEYVDVFGIRRTPAPDMLVRYVTDRLCYDVQILPVVADDDSLCIFFGGSGRSTNCP